MLLGRLALARLQVLEEGRSTQGVDMAKDVIAVDMVGRWDPRAVLARLKRDGGQLALGGLAIGFRLPQGEGNHLAVNTPEPVRAEEARSSGAAFQQLTESLAERTASLG